MLGDLVDRKQSQADHAAKEEKECMDKYLSKWETLDPGADREKERAGESQRVKEAALAEAQHYIRVTLSKSFGQMGTEVTQLGPVWEQPTCTLRHVIYLHSFHWYLCPNLKWVASCQQAMLSVELALKT